MPLAGADRELLEQRFAEVYGMRLDEMGPDIAAYRIEATWFVAFAFAPSADQH